MKSHLWGTALLGIIFLTGQAQASIITIDFTGFANGTSITNQFKDAFGTTNSGVLFSSSGGDANLVFFDTFDNPPTGNNVICTGVSGVGIDCTHDVILQFTDPGGVSNITFDALANQTPLGQAFATVDVFTSTVNHLGIPLLVTHTTHNPPPATDEAPDPQTLTFPHITQITIHPSASELLFNGTEYDNFVITQDLSVTVSPEPATFFLTGFCGIVLLGRRFLARKRA